MSGTLYGVGVGPGDPDLITLKAHRLISGAAVIAYPAPDTGESFARSIAAGFIPAGAIEIPIVVPMRSERFPAREVYDGAAAEIGGHLDSGRDVVVLCEGDPFFYGSFMYLFERLAPLHACEIVPGVTSLTACASALGRPLAARNDHFAVIPAPLDEAALRARLVECDAAAIIKVGRHFAKVRRLVEELGLTEKAGYVARATLANQQVMPLVDVAGDEAPYFSMILIYKGDEPWSLAPQSSS
ncbi:precorrin-2/cobalt-factor-2 C20-methyltransferase [Breoghania corrubedonensis]|uniref:Precorrin-2/cobalt-factor-2 C20-methyltransferase n=1 Tax=Breoghania corrubedonensis TaxID=665038 RepID=A0A2T5VG14_9HYPH|nr:precorrin-2 C(20)-methyltransferase [Breoghania corrubedonensis]PTW62666.1 precorrin-2/cobalt-factor-2 C20-methyltransferase [Breoghania corrubedonensis]